jgi:hypothetical protein
MENSKGNDKTVYMQNEGTNEKNILQEEKENIKLNNKKPSIKLNIEIPKDNGEECIYPFNYKRSYSCKGSKTIKFLYNNEEIKFNLNKKFINIKTPQIKPQKSALVPNPINIGISLSAKKSKFNPLNDEKAILSEGENEESDEYSSDSNDESFGEKENQELMSKKSANIRDEDANIGNEVIKEEDFDQNKIKEEKDEFDENGFIILKEVRKSMVQSRKFVSKRYKSYDVIEDLMMEKYKKMKENILSLNDNKDGEVPRSLYNTIGFQKKSLPILDFLRKNSESLSYKK